MKSKLLLMLCMSVLIVGFTGCKDDDEDTNYAAEIAGTYSGNYTMSGATIATGAEISMTRKSDNKVTLAVDQTIVNFEVKINCDSDVTYANNVYNISGTSSITWEVAEGITMPIDVKVTGTVNKSKQVTLTIAVGEAVSQQGEVEGFPLTVVFAGTKK